MPYLKVAILSLLLTGCAADYNWIKVKNSVDNRIWYHVTESEMYKQCKTTKEQKPNLGACAYMFSDLCDIYSKYSEWQADRIISGDGITLYEHEHKHCDGYIHQ